jgi:hypothetical protein
MVPHQKKVQVILQAMKVLLKVKALKKINLKKYQRSKNSRPKNK